MGNGCLYHFCRVHADHIVLITDSLGEGGRCQGSGNNQGARELLAEPDRAPQIGLVIAGGNNKYRLLFPGHYLTEKSLPDFRVVNIPFIGVAAVFSFALHLLIGNQRLPDACSSNCSSMLWPNPPNPASTTVSRYSVALNRRISRSLANWVAANSY